MFIGFVSFCFLFSGFVSPSPVENTDVVKPFALPTLTQPQPTKCNNSETIQNLLQVIHAIKNQQMEHQAHSSLLLNLLIKVINKNINSYDQREAESINEILKPFNTIINYPNIETFCAQALWQILQLSRNVYARLIHGHDGVDLNLSESDSLESGENSMSSSDYESLEHLFNSDEPLNVSGEYNDYQTHGKQTTKSSQEYDSSDSVSIDEKYHRPNEKNDIEIVHENPEIVKYHNPTRSSEEVKSKIEIPEPFTEQNYYIKYNNPPNNNPYYVDLKEIEDHYPWYYNNELNDNHHRDNRQDWYEHYYIFKVKVPVPKKEIADSYHYGYSQNPYEHYTPHEHLYYDISADSDNDDISKNEKIIVDIITPTGYPVKEKETLDSTGENFITDTLHNLHNVDYYKPIETTIKNTVTVDIDSNADQYYKYPTVHQTDFRTSESDETSFDSNDNGAKATTQTFSDEISSYEPYVSEDDTPTVPSYDSSDTEIKLLTTDLPVTTLPNISNDYLEANETFNFDRPTTDIVSTVNTELIEKRTEIPIITNGKELVIMNLTTTEDNLTGHDQLDDNEVFAKLADNSPEPDSEELILITEVIENIEQQLDPNTESKWLAIVAQIKRKIKDPSLSKNTYSHILEKLRQLLKEVREKHKTIINNFATIMSLPLSYRLMTNDKTTNYVVEVIYLIKSAKPVTNVIEYFIKYHIPVNELEKLSSKEPSDEKEQELHLKLLKLSKIVSLSAALKKFSKEDLDLLTVMYGHVMVIKLLTGGNVIVYKESFNPKMKSNIGHATKHKKDGIQGSIKEVRIKLNDKPYHTITTIGDFKNTPIIEDNNSITFDYINDLSNPLNKISPVHKLWETYKLAAEDKQKINNTEYLSLLNNIFNKNHEVKKVSLPLPYSKTMQNLIQATKLATAQKQKKDNIAENLQTPKLKYIKPAVFNNNANNIGYGGTWVWIPTIPVE